MKLGSCLVQLPALLLALPLAASATVYKWTDERGTTVFSNRPPAAAPKPGNGNDLQERVRALEQQVLALQTPASAHVSDYAAPYPAQLPPPSAYPPPPMSGFGGHRFGVRPMPVAHAMGVPHRR